MWFVCVQVQKSMGAHLVNGCTKSIQLLGFKEYFSQLPSVKYLKQSFSTLLIKPKASWLKKLKSCCSLHFCMQCKVQSF